MALRLRLRGAVLNEVRNDAVHLELPEVLVGTDFSEGLVRPVLDGHGLPEVLIPGASISVEGLERVP